MKKINGKDGLRDNGNRLKDTYPKVKLAFDCAEDFIESIESAVDKDGECKTILEVIKYRVDNKKRYDCSAPMCEEMLKYE